MSAANIHKNLLTKEYLHQLFKDSIDRKSSAGRDGVKIDQFKFNLDREIDTAYRKVKAGTYEFTSYREKLISKGAGLKPRQISIPTIRDKLVLKFLSALLLEIYPECQLPPPHKFIKDIHKESLASKTADHYLRLDVKNFYGTIDHAVLMRKLRRKIRKTQILHLIQNAIQTPTGTKKSLGVKNSMGVPQGLSISNILASIYMIDADERFSATKDISYFRFVDDILAIGSHEAIEQQANEIPNFLKSELKICCHPLGSNDKSIMISTNEGISYLGYHFCKQNIKVRETSYKKMFERLMKLFTQFKYHRNVEWLIWRLNLKISGCIIKERRIGWMFFFSQTNNMRQLKRLDYFVQQNAKKILSEQDKKRVKSFHRAFYEIRNEPESIYYVNFDDLDFDQKKNLLKEQLPPIQTKDLDSKNDEDVELMFARFVQRETAELERDVFSAIPS